MKTSAATVRSVARMLVLALSFVSMRLVQAHDGPEHDIEELTERILKEGESADLLLQRAIEYQVIRKAGEAVKDLERAIHLEPESPAIQRELGRAYFSTGKTNEALQIVTRGIEGSASGADLASLLIVRAEVLRARKENKKALADANEAIQAHPNNVEWYLFRSQLHYALKLPSDRVRGLEEGIRETGSGVLEREWIDALIEDGQHAAALEKIEAELKSSRLRSSWLIRRARVRMATGQNEAGKLDLQAALKELNTRISSAAPDASLLADRGLAYELVGDKESARKDYTQARDKGFTEEWLSDRLRALKK
jgi:tetratricopeptide (TPR) repeat protein